MVDPNSLLDHSPQQFAEHWLDHLLREVLPQRVRDLAESAIAARIVHLLADNVPTHPVMQERRRLLLAGLEALRKSERPTVEQAIELRAAAIVQGGGGASVWADEETYEAIRDTLAKFRGLVDELKEFAVFDPREAEQAAQTTADLVSVVEAAFADFSAAKNDAGLLDFNDLLVKTRDLLRSSSEVRAEATASIDALLVDEFQDTDPIQSEIVKTLVGDGMKTGKLSLVGDAKQSIYRFRGADPACLRSPPPTNHRSRGRLPLTKTFAASRPS